MKGLIIVEGKEDQKFITKLLELIKIDNDVIAQVSNEKRGSKFHVINTDNISRIINDSKYKFEKVLLICDADSEEQKGECDGFTKTKKIITEVVKKLGSQNTQTISYYILPDNKNDGTLETLYLESLPTKLKNTLDCVTTYLSCLKKKGHSTNKSDKIISSTLLAPLGAKDNVRAAGYAADSEQCEDYWDFNSKDTQKLINFIQKFFKN